jgi:DNA invertase Pin-like site-specific DNA recombinase
MGRFIDYARVSKDENLQLQVDALIKMGCQENCIFTDKISEAKDHRPELDSCLKYLIKGDTLIIWRLDRLGRSMSHLVNLIETLHQQGIGFTSICDDITDLPHKIKASSPKYPIKECLQDVFFFIFFIFNVASTNLYNLFLKCIANKYVT